MAKQLMTRQRDAKGSVPCEAKNVLATFFLELAHPGNGFVG